jgi:hypothetical protein
MQKQNFCRAWINKDEQTQICFLQGGVGWGVGFVVCVQIFVQQLGLGNTGMRDMRKKNSGCGVFFCVWTDICLGPWTWQQNGMGDTYEGKKKF